LDDLGESAFTTSASSYFFKDAYRRHVVHLENGAPQILDSFLGLFISFGSLFEQSEIFLVPLDNHKRRSTSTSTSTSTAIIIISGIYI
jgi:hypothetical protein